MGKASPMDEKGGNRECPWVVGNGGKGRAFHSAFSREEAACLYVPAEDFPRRAAEARKNGSFPAVVYVVLEEGDSRCMASLLACLWEWPCYDLRIARSEQDPFPYFSGTGTEEAGLSFIGFRYCGLSPWGLRAKRGADVLVCSALLLLLSPVFLASAVLVAAGSPGGVFYAQERIGRGGKAFRIYKFRSMRAGAESGGPCLSHRGDSRITAWGRVMRRFRIDELPQLWNVLKGDMALVGYRPEREHFIRLISEVSPYYTLLYAIKPGITSLGITTFGYAENVEEMLVRLEKDMEYLSRVSLREDLRVVGKTVKVVACGAGK